jgi:hypothetical protein
MAKLSTLGAAGRGARAIPAPTADRIPSTFLRGGYRRAIRGLQVDRGSGNREISRQDDGHFALLFVGRLNSYFHVLTQGCEEVEEPPDREIAGAIAGKR